MASSIPSYVVGLVVIAGGSFAYLKKGSIDSLIWSSVLGVTMIVGGYLSSRGNSVGSSISGVGSLAISVVGAARYSATQKSMPAVPIFIIGILSFIYHLQKSGGKSKNE